MKAYFKYIFMISLSVGLGSCKKYLDVTPANVGTIDYAFRNRNEAENYLFTCYAALQQLNNVQTNAGFTTSGEIVFPDNLRDNQSVKPGGFNLLRGTQTVANPGLNYWDGEEGGQAIFKAIRMCNTMLENIDKPIDLTVAEKERWIGEVKFLKAYYHYYLFRMYGPIPITDVNLPINSSVEQVRVKRDPADAVVSYIVKLLDEAAPALPVRIQNQARELGRITRVIALSVKAEVLVTAASPLFNGNPDFAGLVDKSGTPLFSAQDPTKWDRAAIACKEAIDLCESSGLSLHTTVPQSGGIPVGLTDSLKRVLMLQTAITEKWELNTELIWALNPTFNFGAQEYNMPRLTQNSAAKLIAQGTFAVPIAEQELFYTNHGVPITEDKTWDYNNRYTLQTGDFNNRFYIHNGYETVKAHFNREPRFYSSVAFDGGVWYGNGQLSNPDNALYVQGRGLSGFAGPKDEVRINIAGYWAKKLVNYLTVYDSDMTWEPFHLPLMRLSGLYLLYAEALNEQGRGAAEVVTWIDKVRTRAALPGVVQAWSAYSNRPGKYNDQAGMRSIIHQERRIELAFEAQAGWDLRRWKELQTVLSQPVLGWNIYEEAPSNYYRPRALFTPVFNVRNYLWPIKADALVINPNLVQNPLW